MRLFIIGIVSFAIFVFLPSCNHIEKEPLTVSGVLTNITMCQEDSSYTTFLLQFEDGQVQKCRARFRDPCRFWMNKHNTVKMDSRGTILEVQCD